MLSLVSSFDKYEFSDTSLGAQSTSPPPPSLLNDDFTDTGTIAFANPQSTAADYCNRPGSFVVGKGTIGAWQPYKGNAVEVWRADNETFVELNGGSAPQIAYYGIKQRITNVVPGCYLLTWKQLARFNTLAKGSPYTVKVYYKNVIIGQYTQKSNFDNLTWTDNAFTFRITKKLLDGAPKSVPTGSSTPEPEIYIAFVPGLTSLSYGALIDKISLGLIELVDTKDPNNNSDDVSIAHWDVAQTITNKNIAWIAAQSSINNPHPKMPQLELRAPTVPSGFSLEAKFYVEYTRGNDAGVKIDTVQIPIPITLPNKKIQDYKKISGSVWQIWQDYANKPFFGGTGKVSFRLARFVDGKLSYDTSNYITFRIGGENPLPDLVKSYINTLPNTKPDESLWYSYAIAKWETKDRNGEKTRYNHFYTSPLRKSDNLYSTRLKYVGYPVWGNDGLGKPGGYGLFQVTVPNIPGEQIWNWQKNCEAGLTIITGKSQQAFNKMQEQRLLAGNTALPPLTVKGVVFTDAAGSKKIMEHACAIKNFNGASRPSKFSTIDIDPVPNGFIIDPYSAGIYCYWRQVKIVQKGEDTLCDHGIRKNVNPQWALSRLSSRNQNYVQDVCGEID